MGAQEPDAGCAMWRRIDTPGHDAAQLTRHGAGWLLRGTAVFKHYIGPACINYRVDLDQDWNTRCGEVHGFLADRPIKASIGRTSGAWTIDGASIPGLDHLAHLDYGFTPATNLQQIRAMALKQGQSMSLPVAWFDLDAGTLTELPQRYERIGEAAYRYAAPTIPYEAVLELSPDAFVASYPGLWVTEA
jgi:hypothetical protein